MKSRHAVKVSAALLLAAGCAAAPPRPATPPEGPAAAAACAAVEGGWAGTFQVRGDREGDEAQDLTIAFVVASGRARVFLVERGQWMEAKPGAFQLRCLGPSALMHAIDSGEDDTGPWFETWTLSAAPHGPDEVHARWSRLVTNPRLPVESSSHAFSFGGAGWLERIRLPAPPQGCAQEAGLSFGETLVRACACGGQEACRLAEQAAPPRAGP